MRIALLGPLEVLNGDRVVTIRGARLRALLARLALEPGRVIATSTLVDELWGQALPADAGNALQSLVSRLRRSLGPAAPAVVSTALGYELRIDPDDVDVHEFSDLARRGRHLLEDDQAAAAARTLRQALALWRGPPLSDISDVPYARPAADRLVEQELSTRTDRIEADLALGRYREVIPELEGLIESHPLRERLSGQLMTALFHAGRQADALARYETTRTALADSLGVDPSPELQRVHLELLRGELPVLQQQPQTNLRAQLTSFIGRESEVARLTAALTRARLVTIVGPGGAGKTRLASETAATMVPESPGGIWFIGLASIADAAEIVPAILSILGGREYSLLDRRGVTLADAEDRLISHIGQGRMLLVLDNCEHLVAAVAGLTDTLLAACPQLRVLATSREPLSITGETLAPIPPLALPEADVPDRELAEAPAIQLFLDRARAVRPNFTAALGAVREICAALDGMPLAIELAAARLRSLSIEQIRDRLDDRFRLLTAGSRTALPRHQTLRAVVDWSWELLEKRERLVAARISMFPAGATLEAIERICADDIGPNGVDDITDAVTGLVDKSFVEADVEAGADRYRMLETIRAYAGEALRESGAYGRVQAAYTRYFRDWVRAAEPHLRRADQVLWMRRILTEQDNIRSALRLSIDAREVPVATELTAAMCWFWALRGSHAESASWFREIRALPESEAPAAARAIVDICYVINPVVTGYQGVPLRPLAEARRLCRTLDLSREHPILSMIETGIAAVREDFGHAWDELTAALTHPDPWAGAIGNMFQGQLRENLGEIAEAEEHLEHASRRFEEIGDRWGMATSLGALSRIRSVHGNLEGAIDADTRSLAMVEELEALDDMPQLLAQRAQHRLFLGDVEGASQDAEEAVVNGERIGHPEGVLFSHVTMAMVERRRGKPAAARDRMNRQRESIGVSGFAADLSRALIDIELTYIALAEGKLDEAHSNALSAIHNGTLDMTFLAPGTEAIAEIARRQGDPNRAATLLGVAHGLRGAPEQGRPEVRNSTAALREALTEEEFSAAYRRGQEMSRDEAVSFADPENQVRRR